MKSPRMLVAVTAAVVTACASPPPPLPATFDNVDARLAFTLDLPEGKAPFPAIVLGHGSGRVTRDQLKFTADRLRGFGFAVLRFDKRGVGESTGQFVAVGTRDSTAVFPQLAGDIEAAVAGEHSRAPTRSPT